MKRGGYRTVLKEVDKILNYGGLDRDVYNKYEDYILNQDMIILRVYMIVTAVGFLAVGLMSLFTVKITIANTRLYLATAAFMTVLLGCFHIVMHLHGDSVLLKGLLIYAFMATLYAESIILTVQLPDKLAVTFVGVILMLPLLFARRPSYTILLQILAASVFCILVQVYKDPDVAFNDVWNAVSFTCVSIAEIMFVVPIRIQNLAQTQIIKELSEFDLLTGVKNRNCYEATCKSYSESRKPAVVVYVDANGLHELNNTRGHAAGDAMLKAVAASLRDSFGQEYTYRFGGDEFIIIRPNTELEWARELSEACRKSLEKKGHSVSYGCAVTQSGDDHLDFVVKRAEAEMYSYKARYYHSVGSDGRSRR